MKLKTASQSLEPALTNVSQSFASNGIDEMQEFAIKGPLARIPSEGIIRSIDVLTKDGWIRIVGQ